jgi:hypothetical protein
MHVFRRLPRALRISIAVCGVLAFLSGYTITFAKEPTLGAVDTTDSNIVFGRQQ